MQDIAIIGAGAAGLFCAGLAAARGHSVLLLDHRTKIAEKIRISGGGRCNFTNRHCGPEHFLSANPHFVKSALSGFGPEDFIRHVQRCKIPFHEKKYGQLFCDNSAQDIITMLRGACMKYGVQTAFGTAIKSLQKTADHFEIVCMDKTYNAQKLVVATGGLSIPKTGASPLGYEIARQFGIAVTQTRPALVPLTFSGQMKEFCAELAGLSVDAAVGCGNTAFCEGLLFSHRGITGPSILQISSYWREGMTLSVNLLPHCNAGSYLVAAKQNQPSQNIHKCLSGLLPRRLAQHLCDYHKIGHNAGSHQTGGRLADCTHRALTAFGDEINDWQLLPAGSEGYRTAEVTLGGVDTDALSARDMQAKSVPGLYFIGEVVDVTGHLGGHNFQWAWSSAYAVASHL